METLLLHSDAKAATDHVLSNLDFEADYTVTRQPRYPDHDALREAIYELHATEPVTTPAHVDALLGRLATVAEGGSVPVVITGRCAEPVQLRIENAAHVANIAAEQAIVADAIGEEALFIPRAMGQAAKPRSQGPKLLADGTLEYPYMGDAINGEHEDERTPDPSRMVGMALQSRGIKETLEASTGQQVHAAHEALLLPYEHAMMRVDPQTDRVYGLSGELLWAGVRTNGLASGPVDLLTQIANPVGVKVGPATTPEDITMLVDTLNPEREPGRLTFMLRTGPEHKERQAALLKVIGNTAPQAVLLYDIHALGKDRNIPRLIGDIQETARACGKAGLLLHGVHLESINDNSRLECADRPDQQPTHPGGVDPQLNPRQLDHVLHSIGSSLLQS
jgi:3-deoxy-7-phosphoheptulonate synthase